MNKIGKQRMPKQVHDTIDPLREVGKQYFDKNMTHFKERVMGHANLTDSESTNKPKTSVALDASMSEP